MTLLVLSCAFLAGVALGLYVGGSWYVGLGLSAALASLALLRPRWRVTTPWAGFSPWIVLIPLALGLARGQYAHQYTPDEAVLLSLAARQARVHVRGVLVRPLGVEGNTVRFVLRVQRVRLERSTQAISLKKDARLLVRVPWEVARTWRYGDEIVVRGRLWRPQPGSTYQAYLARYGAVAVLDAQEGGWISGGHGNALWAWIYALRDRAYALVRQYWPAPEYSLFAGVLLGLEGDIPPDLYDAFRATGTAHIIVISGFNITVIAGLMVRVFGRALGKRWGGLAAGIAIALYTVLVGADAAVVRAALMGGLALLAQQVGRRQHGYTTLAFTAALMAAWQPWVLRDIGFQLSFAATAGLMLFGEPLTRLTAQILGRVLPTAWVQAVLPSVSEFFLLTLAAQIMTWPLAAYYFRRVSLISLVANPVILPAQAPLMILGGLAVLVGLAVPSVGQVLAWLAWPWAAYTIRMVELFASFRTTTVALPPIPGVLVVGYYALLGFAWLSWPRVKGELRPWLRPSLLALLLFVLDWGIWARVTTAPDGWLHLWFLPTASGQAVLLRGPQGGWVLINGGEDPVALERALGRWRAGPRFDWWVIASNRREEVAALARVIDRYTPARVWWLPTTGRDRAYRLLYTDLTARGVPIYLGQVGQALRQGTWTLRLVQLTRRGGVLLLRYQGFAAWLAWEPDVTTLPAAEPVTIYLLAQGGLAATNSAAHVRASRPWLVVASPIPGALWEVSSAAPRVAIPPEVPLLVPYAVDGIHVWTDGTRWGAATGRPANLVQYSVGGRRP
ncbi:MAG: ComEC family competence protein [Chloroflexi bacterium]|nr:ComEC family competence protein [Chloroflexota bacterium]